VTDLETQRLRNESDCPSCELLRAAVAQSEYERERIRSEANVYRRDANQAWKVAKAPDATLRLMVAEMAGNLELLRAENLRMQRELAELVALAGCDDLGAAAREGENVAR